MRELRYVRLGVIAFVLGTSGCASPSLEFSALPEARTIKKVALLQAMIGPIDLPIFPLLDAAALAAQVDGSRYAIVAKERALIDSFREITSRLLKAELNYDVVVGSAISHEALESAGVPSRLPDAGRYPRGATQRDDDGSDAPATQRGSWMPVVFAENERNYLEFDGDDFLDLDALEDQASEISKICEILHVDALAFSYSELDVTSTAILRGGTVRLVSRLFLVNSEGRIVLDGSFKTESSSFRGANAEDLAVPLLKFERWMQDLLIEARAFLFERPGVDSKVDS